MYGVAQNRYKSLNWGKLIQYTCFSSCLEPHTDILRKVFTISALISIFFLILTAIIYIKVCICDHHWNLLSKGERFSRYLIWTTYMVTLCWATSSASPWSPCSWSWSTMCHTSFLPLYVLLLVMLDTFSQSPCLPGWLYWALICSGHFAKLGK